jgi:DHA2 family multidrug resistance protein
MSIFGVIVLLGPLLGPIIGGYLAEEVNWRWCFFLNLPVGAALVTLLLVGLPRHGANLKLLAQADWLGIFGMAVAFSCLTMVLEDGQRDRWFESSTIVYLTVASLMGFIALVVAQKTSVDPVIRLSLLRNGAFASATLIALVVGAATMLRPFSFRSSSVELQATTHGRLEESWRSQLSLCFCWFLFCRGSSGAWMRG